MLCIMILFCYKVYLMLGSEKLTCCHAHSTDTSLRIIVVSHLRLYVIVTVCCQSWRDFSEETAMSGYKAIP
jgi:hypothetical protein